MSEHKEQIAPDNISSFNLLWIGVVFTIAILVTVILGEALYFGAQRTETRLKAKLTVYRDLELFRAEQQEQLQKTGWIDRVNGIVQIPIDDAMEMVVRRVAAGEPILIIEPMEETTEEEAQADEVSAGLEPVEGAATVQETDADPKGVPDVE